MDAVDRECLRRPSLWLGGAVGNTTTCLSHVRPNMAPSSSCKPTPVQCERCGVLVAQHRLKKHLKRVHSPERQAAQEAADTKLRLVKARTQYLARKLKCPVCAHSIQIGQIKSHFGNAHARQAPNELLQLLGESVGVNRFSSVREREAYWRQQSGVIHEGASQDLFDRTNVLSGGAYGLGKNRKH